MRIIAGIHRGRAIRLPDSTAVRPTGDRVREAVFNILGHSIAWPGFEGIRVLDVFAGSGACGLEALSRGASHATFIDHDGVSLMGIKRNAAALGEANAVTLLKLDATKLPPPPLAAGCPCALALLDAPYGSDRSVPALHGLASRRWLDRGGLAVVEIGAREAFAPPPGYSLLDARTYGAAQVVFLRVE